MSDYEFDIEDLLDFSTGEGLPSRTRDAVVREMGKNYAGPLETTAKRNNFNRGTSSSLDISQVLMSQVLFKDTETLANRNEYMMSGLLGGALTSEDSEGNLGIFDEMVPNDIKTYAGMKRDEWGIVAAASAGAAADGSGGGTGSGEYNTEDYVFYAEQLIAHPNFRLQSRGDKNGDANRVLADLREGLINPWLIAVMKILADNFAIYVGNFDATKTSGHMKNSQHYKGNAVDIGDIGPKGSAWGANKDPLSTGTPLVQQVFTCLNSIHGPWRPSVVIGPAFPSFGGGGKARVEGTSFSTNSDHSGSNGHFHIDCNVRPRPEDIPPPKRSTTSPPTGGVRNNR